jgi:hypothetical protein
MVDIIRTDDMILEVLEKRPFSDMAGYAVRFRVAYCSKDIREVFKIGLVQFGSECEFVGSLPMGLACSAKAEDLDSLKKELVRKLMVNCMKFDYPGDEACFIIPPNILYTKLYLSEIY